MCSSLAVLCDRATNLCPTYPTLANHGMGAHRTVFVERGCAVKHPCLNLDIIQTEGIGKVNVLGMPVRTCGDQFVFHADNIFLLSLSKSARIMVCM